MASMDEQILRAAKEIVVKFIETGRVSPTGFADNFQNVYDTILDTVERGRRRGETPEKQTTPSTDG